MTPTECNIFHEVLTMRGTAFKLIIKRAKQIQTDSLDKHIYSTQLKSNCANNAKDILEMAESIQHRAELALKVIEEQRKAFRAEI